MRTHRFPQGAPLIADHLCAEAIKNHSCYKAAKAGDTEAALRLVRDIVSPASVKTALDSFGEGAVYVPVTSREMTGHNQIPNALAWYYASLTNGLKSSGIVQVNKSWHTGANAMERLIARCEFDGDVRPGARYVLVDDVSTMGGTIADLSSYLQSNGGVVLGGILLCNSSRSGTIHAQEKIVRRLEAQHGDEIEKLFGISSAALTNDEAGYLINFRTTDELRTRATSASAERSRRISAKTLPRRQACLKETPPWLNRDVRNILASQDESLEYSVRFT